MHMVPVVYHAFYTIWKPEVEPTVIPIVNEIVAKGIREPPTYIILLGLIVNTLHLKRLLELIHVLRSSLLFKGDGQGCV